jgi:glucose/arabinose dehydrogenase
MDPMRKARAAIAAFVLLGALLMGESATTSAAVVRPSAPVAPAVVAAAPAISLSLVVGGLSNPVFATSARDGSGRLFIVEKTGRIRIFKNGQLLATPFLNISGSVSGGSEQGLLGLAFSPGFATNHKFYVDYTRLNGDTVISEYRSGTTGSADVADWHTGRVVLKVVQPYDNHNGGMLAFGRDGYLYVGMGDGGSAGDPGNRAQSLNTLLGKILRIDVTGTTSTTAYRIPSTNPYVGHTGLDEIWDFGLRNPWRFSFDRANGNLWIGDVGQNAWEEVDRATYFSAPAGKGLNWGWHVMEGRHCYSPSTGCNTSGKTLPPVEYDHNGGRCAVTGGYVYRGTAIPALVGAYVFGDYCSGEIWYTTATSTAAAPKTLLLDTAFNVSSFGEDQAGELYVCDLNGGVYKVMPG